MQPDALFPDAQLRDLLSRFKLAQRHRVSNALRASHTSRQRGDGLEFHQFRGYLPGDDLRKVDWRLYGRTDKLYVREAEQESRLTVCLFIDTTGSMGMAGATGPSRLLLACRYAAAIGWLALQRQHDFGLVTLTDDTPVYLQPATGTAHYQRFLRALSTLEAKGEWPARANLRKVMQALPARSKVYALSDFFERRREQSESVRELLGMAHGLTSIQILLDEEMQFAHRGQLEIVERESGDRRLVDAKRYREEYLQRMASLLDEIQREQIALGARFVRVLTRHTLAEIVNVSLDNALPPGARLLAEVGQ